MEALGKGVATITAKADGKTGSCQIAVLAPVEGITLNKTSLNLEVGQEETLIATLVPADATPKGEVVWTSSNTKVATVDEGKVKAIEEGMATISVSVDRYRSDCSISVSKPAYPVPSFMEVNVPGKYLAWGTDGFTDVVWYYRLSEKKQQFLYPHILVSYVASEWYKADNMEYIIMGESGEEISCENVGDPSPSYIGIHCDYGYRHIKNFTPSATIKSCAGAWQYALSYINNHPDNLYMFSCAADVLGGNTPDDLRKDSNYQYLKDILDKDNVIVSVASGNRSSALAIVIEESHAQMDGCNYTSASVSSNKNNKYTIVGCNPNQNGIFGDDEQSCYPLGFGKGNLIVPFTPLVTIKGNENTDTKSSYPTATFSSTLGNFLSILMKTHPGVTLEGASTIMQESYFRAEKMKYKDDDGEVKEGEDWHFFKTDEFIAREILHQDAVDAAFSSSAQEIDLPSSGGLCYIGPGIRYTIDGTIYEMTESNRPTMVSALSARKEVKWSFSGTLANTYATSSASITVRVLDHSGNLIPDIKRTVSVGI